MNIKSLGAALSLTIMLVGCANFKPMAFNEKSKTVDTKDKSILLMSINLSRVEKSRYVPHPIAVNFIRETPQGKPETISFKVDDDAGDTASDDNRNIYRIRVALDPGSYKLATIGGDANAFPVHGFFNIPIFSDISVPANMIGYVGRINAVLRPRKDGEFRAGPPFPLIDQAVTGISNGTFDISIENQYDDDVTEFKQVFPVLHDAKIEKLPVPKFDLNTALEFWEGKPKENLHKDGVQDTLAGAH